MRLHLVMPPAPHTTADGAAGTGAAWDSVLSDTPQHCQRSSTPPAAVPGASTVVLLPAAALSWHRVQLPPGLLGRHGEARNATRLRAALEGLLEDQLLDDPARLHFALAPDAASAGPLWVAVCDKAWLHQTLQTLTHAGHRVQRIAPEWAPLPEGSPTALWFAGEAEACTVVWADAHGVHARPLPHGETQQHAGLPADASLWAEPGCAARAEQLLHREAQVHNRGQRLLDAANSPWNLAQGEFAHRNAFGHKLLDAIRSAWDAPAWRPARWAVAVLCGVQLLGLNAQAWQAREALATQRAALQGVLLSTFPATTVVVDAPRQMERAVAVLGQHSGQLQNRDLERLLEAFGTLAPVEYAPAAIEFVAGELRLTPPPGAGAEPTESLRSGLQARGYRVRQDGNTWVISP